MLGDGAAPGQVAQLGHALGLDLPLAFLALVVSAAFAIPSGMLTAAARRPTALSGVCYQNDR